MKAVGIPSAWGWYWKAQDGQDVSRLYLTSHSHSVRLLLLEINNQINWSLGMYLFSFLSLSLPKVKGLVVPWNVPAALCCFPAVSVAWEPGKPWIDGMEMVCLKCHES